MIVLGLLPLWRKRGLDGSMGREFAKGFVKVFQ
jgi:hypothetical protein